MSAPSDGAIVLTVVQPTRDPTVLETIRWHVPNMIIALWLGATMGGYLGQCIR